MNTEECVQRIEKIRLILSPIMPYGIGEAIRIAQAQSENRYDALIAEAWVKIGPILQDALAEYENS